MLGQVQTDFLDIDGDGDTAELVPFAADGAPRVTGSVDIGAFETSIDPFNLFVDITVDQDDGDYTAGDLSLREALSLVAPGGEITFADGIGQAFEGGGTITVTSALPTLTSELTIGGDNNVTVDGGGRFRVFAVGNGGDVTFQDLTITGRSSAYGGGIFINGTTAMATIVGSTITGDTATNLGGGLNGFSGATVAIVDSTISNNAANFAGARSSSDSSTTVSIYNSTLSGKSANTNGGAIQNSGGATLTLTNTTVAGNSAANVGGILNSSAAATLINTTVTGNFATGSAGGVISQSTGATLTLANSLLLGNQDGAGDDNLTNYAGSVLNDLGSNLIGGTVADVFDTVVTIDPDSTPGNGDEFDAGVLADNGGPLQTVALNIANASNPALAAQLDESTLGLDLNGDGDTIIGGAGDDMLFGDGARSFVPRQIAIEISGLEDPALGEGRFQLNASGWVASGVGGVLNPGTAQFADHAPEGENTGFVSVGSVTNTLSESYDSATRCRCWSATGWTTCPPAIWCACSPAQP